MTGPAYRQITEEEYLALEKESPIKHEYIDGVIYAQAGGTLPHIRITRNVNRLLANATEGGPCWAYGSDMKVRISRLGRTFYYYPDAVVVCMPHDELKVGEENPCLIVEILSASTRKVDMTYKAQDYLTLPSLQAYLMIDSESRSAEVHRRTPNGWTVEVVRDVVELPCLNAVISLHDIYSGVTL